VVLQQQSLRVQAQRSPLTAAATSPDLLSQPEQTRHPRRLAQQARRSARHQLAPKALLLARLNPRLQRRQGPRLSLGLPAWLLAPQPLDLRLQPAPQRQEPPPLVVRATPQALPRARPRLQQQTAPPVPRQVRPPRQPGPGVGR
jgi:hypothetical protein